MYYVCVSFWWLDTWWWRWLTIKKTCICRAQLPNRKTPFSIFLIWLHYSHFYAQITVQKHVSRWWLHGMFKKNRSLNTCLNAFGKTSWGKIVFRGHITQHVWQLPINYKLHFEILWERIFSIPKLSGFNQTQWENWELKTRPDQS